MATDNNKILVSFLAGAAAGLAMGILLAPDKGSNTRNKLKSRVLNLENELSSAVGNKVNELKGAITSIVSNKDNG